MESGARKIDGLRAYALMWLREESSKWQDVRLPDCKEGSIRQESSIGE